jgi:hypothetical protein
MSRRRIAAFCASIPLLAATTWAVLVLAFANILPGTWRYTGAITFGIVALALLIALWRARRILPAAVCFALALVAVVIGWNGLTPSNTRNWLPDVEKLATATIAGDEVTVRNIRNFDYRTDTDFTPVYYDRTFRVSELVAVDLFAVYWMGPAVAHTILSFEFADDNHLAISIETRKEHGQGYSTVLGFFRHYELIYVVADERDVVRLRTNYRKPPEDVYLYRLQGPIENAQRLFLAYMERLNALAEHPEFYNTLADNCTTGIWLNTLVNKDHLKLSWKLLASGYTPDYLYENGRLDSSLPFSELQQRSLINQRGQAAGDASDFSQQIRTGLPGFGR